MNAIHFLPTWTLACLLLLLGANALATNPPSATGYMEKHPALPLGRDEQAIETAKKAVQDSASHKDRRANLDALLALANAYQAAGQHRNAIVTLDRAMPVAEALEDPLRQLTVMAALGQSYAQTGQSEPAEQWLTRAVEAAAGTQQPQIEATALNNLGNIHLRESRHQQALAAYRKSIQLSERAGLQQLLAQASANAARAALAMQDPEMASGFIRTTLRTSQTLDSSRETAYLLINAASIARDIHAESSASSPEWLTQAYHSLKKAEQIADQIQDPRAKSHAVGHIARLYLQRGRTDEALTLTHEAEFIAQQNNMPDVLFRWQWQRGRLLDQQGKIDDAINAYRQAVQTLQPIRYDIANSYGNRSSAFRELIGPLYFELADLLLRHSPKTNADAQQQQWKLQEARKVIEQFKAAELEDYFQDDCVAELQSRTAGLEQVDKHTAIIYPIILLDRTELLISLPGGIRQFTAQVRAEEITGEIRNLRNTLEKRTTHEYMPHAKQLYRWLISPAWQSLQSAAIETLVIVPDGALRTIPWGTLHDGKEFLIKHFAIAYTPGLEVTDPRPLERQDLKVLLTGLTEQVQGFPPLPHVRDELERIDKIYSGKVLLNEDYQTSRLHQELDKTPYSIVHIASHGQFDRDPDQTFLLTHEDKLTMNQLEQIVGIGQYRDKPVELLTLSACQTAAGDDRAALGLAGVAVKSGARSALATLWFVNDQATALLVSDFYQHLKDSSVSKAGALQQAQINILSDRRYRHPGYWSPYLLIGNWL